MLNVSNAFRTAMTAPVRQFAAEVRLQEDASNLENLSVFTHDDRIKSIEIQRVGDNSKFIGYGISQRLSINLVDLPDAIQPISRSTIKVKIGIVLPEGNVEYVSYPTFHLTEKNRSEEDGDITLTAYDKVDEASEHFITELNLSKPYTVKDFINACATVLGVQTVFEGFPDNDYLLNMSYPDGANFAGTENLRQCLNAAAEATTSIYFIDYQDRLHFKRLDVSGNPIVTITPNDYFSLSHSDNRRLVSVMHVTELGDNVGVETDISGTTQYVRNNPFWELREDIATIVESATNNVFGLTIHQYDCSHRGFPILECGDKIGLSQVVTGGVVSPAYILDDVINFNGGFTEQTQWSYQNSENETSSNPTNIGEVISHTWARVDKVNRTVTLHASKIEENSSQIGEIQVGVGEISQSVLSVQKNLEDGLEGIGGDIEELVEKVSQTMTKDAIISEIHREITENGVTKVETTTGRFDQDGLLISRSGSEMETRISEDGMTIYRDDTAVLIANNEGVEAFNLKASTYLIVGDNSRFEDYQNDTRTGCFWIGSTY